ncbi:MAG TPA: amylo-alpha-1,6-glucosidase [Polyangiaceae bacterium]|nr:amylo-alpha-1,6-glucosidase [Polyangiaceae bacterium]
MPTTETDTWSSFNDGPWPRAHVGGELERAEGEWLETNDQGVYAMSTLALMHTRRQHGILVTHLGEDFRRHVVVSHLEMTLEVGGRSFQLSTHQFPNVAPTPGYRFLESFAQDPLPRWVYRLPGGTVERTLSLIRGHRGVVSAFTWTGKEPARLHLRPLMPMRPADELSFEHGAMLQKVTLRPGEVEVQPVAQLSPVVFRHGGVFMGSPDWWRRFEYLDDRGRYEDFQEDMWSPGVFELILQPRQTSYLVTFVGRAPTAPPEELVMAAAQHRLACDPGQHESPQVRALCVAAEAFVLGDGEAVVAGYPWLDVWSRDWLLALPGTFLVRDQLERAQRSVALLVARLVDGFLPQRVTAPQDARTPCVDATLWLFPLVAKLVGRGDPHFLSEVMPQLAVMFDRLVDGGPPIAWVDEHGLLANRGSGPLTWMDAKDTHGPYTPRRGWAVELQALWVQAARSFADLCVLHGDPIRAERARHAAERTRTAFRAHFWNAEARYPFDCIEPLEDGEPRHDPSIRPNALIASAIAPDLFESWQRREILARVEERLLTPRGLRTLDPSDAHYADSAGGTLEERRAASHQGTAWAHLLLYYVRARLHEYPESKSELRALVSQALLRGSAFGHVNQFADAEPPHRVRGSPAYAAASAMLLEALVLDLGGASLLPPPL